MRSASYTLPWIPVVLAMVAACSTPDDRASDETFDIEPPRAFAQRFLELYVPLIHRELPRSERIRYLDDSSSFVDRELLDRLRLDFDAQAADTTGTVVAIDWEPFVGDQDPCDRYEAGAVIEKGARRLVHIVAVCGGRRAASTSVSLELLQVNHAWRISNVWHPAGGDLRTTLRRNQEMRAEPPRP